MAIGYKCIKCDGEFKDSECLKCGYHFMDPFRYKPHLLYSEEWEEEFEKKGPIKETVHPSEHMCPVPTRSSAAGRCPSYISGYSGLLYLWDVIEKILEGKKRIIDMGGGESNRRLPKSFTWTLEDGHDMGDINELIESKAKFDLVFSSHSLEHAPSREVPDMITEWLKILAPSGELLILGPHRCGTWWSRCMAGGCHEHLWQPTAACLGNFLISKGLVLINYDDHRCKESSFWIHLRKP